MRVFEMRHDVEKYQYFLFNNDSDVIPQFDGRNMIQEWTPPSVFIEEPKLRPGDFYNFSADPLIINARAATLLKAHWDAAGELLPLPYRGSTYFVVNVTRLVDCLDLQKVKWRFPEDQVDIVKYAFVPDRFDAPLFKLPQQTTCCLALDEFKMAVERAKLHGLEFTEVWSDNI